MFLIHFLSVSPTSYIEFIIYVLITGGKWDFVVEQVVFYEGFLRVCELKVLFTCIYTFRINSLLFVGVYPHHR